MEMIMRKDAVNRAGNIFNKSHMKLAYADENDIIGRGLRDVTAALSSIENPIVNGEYRRRMNHELYGLYNDIEKSSAINSMNGAGRGDQKFIVI